jgi:NADH-quinone oxidoreductase subunit G
VFTDKTHGERYNRKWDMQFAPSICQGCSLGCNTSPGERYGEIRRIENRYNGSVNHYFLCDRGRFGYGFVNRKDRPRQPLVKREGSFVALPPQEAVLHAANLLRSVIGIGSPRASLEANYALRKLVGAENFFDGHSAAEGVLVRKVAKILGEAHVRIPSLRVIEQADAALVLGEDVTNTAPRIALALRQTARGRQVTLAAQKHIADWQAAALSDIGQHEKNPLFIGSVDATRIDDIAAATLRAAPENLARLGFAVAHLIDAAAPAVPGLDAESAALAQTIANALLAAKKPLVVSGTGAGLESVIDAAANVVRALQAKGKHVELSLVVPEVNSMGLALMQAAGLDQALEALRSGAADALVVLENDLYRRAGKSQVDAALKNATLVVADHQMSATAEKAAVLLSAASFAEGDGTVVNNEGRAQRYFQVFDATYYDPKAAIREAWSWLNDLRAQLSSVAAEWKHFDDVTAACAQELPQLAGIVKAAPDAQFRMHGLKVAREPHRYSGRTAMRANISVHEPRASQDADTALAFSMEGHHGTEAGDRPSALIPFAWAPGWNSPQSWNKFQDEVGGHLRGGDAGVRLFDPQAHAAASVYFDTIPAAFAPATGVWRTLALQHIFGGEELSARAAPVAERAPKPYVGLNPADAESLGVGANMLIDVALADEMQRLPLRLLHSLPRGTVGLPFGVEGMAYAEPGATIKLSRVNAA